MVPAGRYFEEDRCTEPVLSKSILTIKREGSSALLVAIADQQTFATMSTVEGPKSKRLTLSPMRTPAFPSLRPLLSLPSAVTRFAWKGVVSPHCMTIATRQPKCKFETATELLCNTSCGATTRTDDSSKRN